MTLLELLNEDGIQGRFPHSKNGKKYECSCPRCGGNARFQVWLDQGNGGRFYCRNCGKTGSVTAYLRFFRNMSFAEAFLASGESYTGRLKNIRIRSDQETVLYRSCEIPSDKWQSQAEEWHQKSVQNLRSTKCADHLSWLMTERGLKKETIINFGLGWFVDDLSFRRSSWGLPENEDATKIFIPPGLVIPCFHNDSIQRLRIRRSDPQKNSRYYTIPGSSSCSMVLGQNSVYVVVESDLDALLLYQEIGDMAGVIALGSAAAKPDEDTFNLLREAQRILIALDNDQAGSQAFYKYWQPNFKNAVRWPVLYGKDITDAYLNGLDLKIWCKLGLFCNSKGNSHSRNQSAVDDSEMIKERLEALKTGDIISFKLVEPYDNKFEKLELCSSDLLPVSVSFDLFNNKEIFNIIKRLLEGTSKKVFHDAKTAFKFFKAFGINIGSKVYDVMLARQILSAGSDNGNGQVNLPARNNLAIRARTIQEIKDNHLLHIADLEFKCIPAVAKMETDGILVDKDKLLEIMDSYLKVKLESENYLHKELGNINLNSNKQRNEALDKKGPLEKDHPILTSIDKYKRTSSRINTIDYLLKEVDAQTGRIHFTYNQIGTDTGRFSCPGYSLHSIPSEKEMRSCFIAAEGHKLVFADYSQIELRVIAEITRDPKMIEAYNKGADIHRLTASLIMGKDFDDVTDSERKAAKAVNFGLLFGMGPDGLKNYAYKNYGINMTADEAHNFYEGFFRVYQGIAKWKNKIEKNSGTQTRTIGCRRRLLLGKKEITKLFNSPVQGTAADIIKKALHLLYERLDKNMAKIVGCIHDEIILEVPVEYAEKAAEILENSMIEAGKVYLEKVPVEVDVVISDNWS